MEGIYAQAGLEEKRLEQEGTALLRAARAFRARGGVRSPRSEAECRARERGFEEWMAAQEIVLLGCVDVWDEMDAIAEALRLSPCEKAVLSMSRVEGYSLRELADALGLTVHRVRVYLDRALEKCRAYEGEAPASARTLFREELRQKHASVYLAPAPPSARRHRRRADESSGSE